MYSLECKLEMMEAGAKYERLQRLAVACWTDGGMVDEVFQDSQAADFRFLRETVAEIRERYGVETP